MEGFAAFLLGLGIMGAAQEAAYAPYRAGYPYPYYYAVPEAHADAGYRPAYVYAPVPSPLPATGAVTGGLIGAAAGGAPGLVLGAMTGAVIGDAMSPRVAYVAPARAAMAYAPASPARSTESTDQYIQRWQGLLEPAPKR